MRVIAGTAKSLKLVTPEGFDTRPTTDRIKETLFNMIQFDIPGCRFLDLFCGSGAIGIEALSRGAEEAVFVDNGKTAIDCMTQNIKNTNFTNKATLLKQDAFVALQSLEYKGAFDIIFMDPPYELELEQKVLEYLTVSSLLHEETLLIFEASLKTDLSYLESLGYDIIKQKKYKTNQHIILKRSTL